MTSLSPTEATPSQCLHWRIHLINGFELAQIWVVTLCSPASVNELRVANQRVTSPTGGGLSTVRPSHLDA
jgi:hypothetical protein